MFYLKDPKYIVFFLNDQIDALYPKDRLPDRLYDPPTEKVKQAKFECLDLNMYKKEARMVAFRTVVERIQAWLKALNLYYYEYMGKLEDRDIS